MSWPFLGSRISAILIGIGYQYKGLVPVDTPTWFIIALLYVYIIQSFGPNVKSFSIITSVLSIILVWIMSKFKVDTLTPLDSALMAYPFFGTGLIVREFIHKRHRFINNILVFIVLLVMTLLVSHINGRVDMNTLNYGSSLFWFYICGIIGSLCVISLSKVVNRIPSFVKITSSGTILILGFNLLAISIVKIIYEQFFNIDSWSSIIGVATGTVILIAFYPIILFCSRYFNCILGK